jgi:hypothetical protein
MMARRSKKGFREYVASQAHREDRVGMLAREWAAKRHWLLRLLFGPDSEALRAAAAKAMMEYGRETKKKK